MSDAQFVPHRFRGTYLVADSTPTADIGAAPSSSKRAPHSGANQEAPFRELTTAVAKAQTTHELSVLLDVHQRVPPSELHGYYRSTSPDNLSRQSTREGPVVDQRGVTFPLSAMERAPAYRTPLHQRSSPSSEPESPGDSVQGSASAARTGGDSAGAPLDESTTPRVLDATGLRTDGEGGCDSDSAAGDSRCAPPHHRCLDYGDVTMMAEEAAAAAHRTPVRTTRNEPAAREDGGHETSTVVIPFTPERTFFHGTRFSRGAAPAEEPTPDTFTALGRGGVSVLVASSPQLVSEVAARCPTTTPARRFAHLDDESSLTITWSRNNSPSYHPLVADEIPPELSLSSSLIVHGREAGPADPFLVGLPDRSSTTGGSGCDNRNPANPCRTLEHDEPASFEMGVTVFSSEEEVLPSSNETSGSEAVAQRNAVERSASGKRRASEEGGRVASGGSASPGCTESATPARSGSRDGPHSEDVIRDSRGWSSNKAEWDTYSPSPEPLSQRPSVDRTVEGKFLTSREERGCLVKTRLTTGGVRLSYDAAEDASSDSRGSGVQQQRRISLTSANALIGFQALRASTAAAAPEWQRSVPSHLAASLLADSTARHEALFTASAQALVAAWSTEVVTSSWLKKEFDAIVGPPVTPPQPVPTGRRRALRLAGAVPPPPMPSAPRPSASFARSPGSMSLSARSGAFMSLTLMSPRTMATTDAVAPHSALPSGGEYAPDKAPDATFVPITSPLHVGSDCDGHSLCDEEVTPSPLLGGSDSGPIGEVQAGSFASAVASPLRHDDRRPAMFDSALPMLFEMFCATAGDEALLTPLLDAYTGSCLQSHDCLMTHAGFNVGYTSGVAIPQLIALEAMARKQLCMTRDLYVRDKIELFVVLTPVVAVPSLAREIVSSIKSSLTNFRKRLLLPPEPAFPKAAVESRPRARSGCKAAAAERCRAQSAAAAPPPRLLVHHSSHRGDRTRREGKQPSLSSRTAASGRPPTARQGSGDTASRRTRPASAARVMPRRQSSSSSTASVGGQSTAVPSRSRRLPRYGSNVSSPAPVTLPNIELLHRKAPVFRAHEYADTVEDKRHNANALEMPTDQDFMDLAKCQH